MKTLLRHASKGHGIISGSGPPSFYLSESEVVFHRIGTLAPAPADDPVFAQILFLAPTKRIEARRRFNGPPEEVRRLDSAYQQIVPVLDGMLRLHKRRVKLFLTAQEFMNSDASHMYQLRLLAPRNRDPRTYNLPTQDEVAVILPGEVPIFNKRSSSGYVTDGHPALMPRNGYTTKIHALINHKTRREWSGAFFAVPRRVQLRTRPFLNHAGPTTFTSPLVDENGNPWPRLFARFTDTKESDVVRYVHLAIEAQRHSGKAVQAHLDKHFEDMIDVPTGSCISIPTDSSTLHDQCKVLEAIR
ncbi:BZ3500_MvSof-1268-A1-R1_Chr5-2g08103 [Microbotryum saponariae]|uniref:BZ3500_MvSof-1268-A1-R1_Chr5-2g08103 protein n=1 Tax=Microbotryum saponariae TaxID=289078 RepID=A0A2X0NEH0_9BASI|nr:BZ3500_MvSof-1268-A1-R1_Chr5-2g08103 [Microbotryum saponariae]SDA05972.1 BZ3501_MvSof-1269-A2-R1_Chr5-2g07925 [Microbotryum saponariae]